MKTKVRTLTPVHVGSGDKYLSLEFELYENKVIFLDVEKIFEDLAEKGEDLLKVAEEVARGEKLASLVDTSRYRVRETPFTGKHSREEILKHIQTSGRPYLPGSSIKGAIRTVLLWKAVKDDPSLLDFALKSIKNKIEKNRINAKLLRSLDDELENRVFRRSKIVNRKGDPKNDLLRALRITDTTPFRKVRVYEVDVLGTELSLLVECIDSGDEADVELAVDDFILNCMHGLNLDLDHVAEASREFAAELIRVEKGRLKEFEAKECLTELKVLESEIKKNSIILRLGWGTGWYSTTIGTLLKTRKEFESLRRRLGLGKKPGSRGVSRNFPVTMKVTSDGKLLGWIKIAL